MKVPGSLKLRNGRYSYKVIYPGDTKPTVKALKIPGQKFATSDKKVAEQLAAIMYNKHIAKKSSDVFDGTIESLCKLYLQDAKDYHTDNAGKVAEYYYTKVYSLALLRKLHGNTMAASFGPKALKSFRKQMISFKELADLQKKIDTKDITKQKQKKLQAEYNKLLDLIGIKKEELRPVCRREINRRITIIKNMWQWGVSEELLPKDAYHAIQTVTGIRKGTRGTYDLPPVKPVDHEIVEFTLRFCTKVLVDMITIHELTGMRPAELCNMKPCEINRTVDPWLYEPPKHKMRYKSKDRKIYFGPLAQKILRPYLLRDQNLYCFSPQESEKQRLAMKRAERTTPIHLGNKPGTNRVESPKRSAGVKYNPRSYNRAISRAIDRARKEKPELPKWFPYQLRHSLGTKMRKEYGIEAASACLGNDLEAAKIYAERDENIAIAAAKKFG